ncbi:CLUMA_CG011314, isoform A [Clunio marinus]|uniref:CLUMA_CG011314, isoform A n=1 Tax=Clunio marinus TaxID=568069 RepID=A0A1J1ICC9_9DIPT|nr:CLUMA_CG011314, isoform A [Clunio marinus]
MRHLCRWRNLLDDLAFQHQFNLFKISFPLSATQLEELANHHCNDNDEALSLKKKSFKFDVIEKIDVKFYF